MTAATRIVRDGITWEELGVFAEERFGDELFDLTARDERWRGHRGRVLAVNQSERGRARASPVWRTLIPC